MRRNLSRSCVFGYAGSDDRREKDPDRRVCHVRFPSRMTRYAIRVFPLVRPGVGLAVMSCACVLLWACQTERVTTSDGWPLPPEPRPIPVPPQSLRADRMAFMVGSKPDDTDNNGFPDLIRASVALFSSEHPTALREQGAFVFMLYPQGSTSIAETRPLAEWRIEGEALQSTLAAAQYGPCYQFSLSLLQTPGGDRLPSDRADMVCTFEPADGSEAVHSAGVRTLQVGGRLTAGR
jgi:hypothetical protein